MNAPENRRAFLRATTAVAATGLLPRSAPADEGARPVRVVVWDERQPAQKQAYEDFLGNAIADHLREQPGFSVRSVALDDPDQGHRRRCPRRLRRADLVGPRPAGRGDARDRPEGRRSDRPGSLGLIALHSAHWSTPFVEAMNERTRRDVERACPPRPRGRPTLREVAPAKRYTVPKRPTPG